MPVYDGASEFTRSLPKTSPTKATIRTIPTIPAVPQ